MFKQVKSALFFYYLYKFRKKAALIFTLFILIILSEYIYSDIVEYLKLRDKLYLLDIVLPLKWAIIIVCIFYIFYSFFSMFEQKVEVDSSRNKKSLSKEDIKNLAKQIIEKKKRRY
jgi:hypothetical protein